MSVVRRREQDRERGGGHARRKNKRPFPVAASPSRVSDNRRLFQLGPYPAPIPGKRILRYLQRRGVITLVAAPGAGDATVVQDETLGERDPLLAKLLAAAATPPTGRAGVSSAGFASPHRVPACSITPITSTTPYARGKPGGASSIGLQRPHSASGAGSQFASPSRARRRSRVPPQLESHRRPTMNILPGYSATSHLR